MNKKLTLSALVIAALMVASMQMAVFAVGNGVTPLGLEIAGKTDEIVTGLQTDIENFITEQKLIIAETQEERLAIIEERKEELTNAIEEAKISRQALIDQLEAGDIPLEDFAAEMKDLATELSSAAKSMGALGELLGLLGQDLAGELKANAQNMVEEMNQANNEIGAEGLEIAEEMSGLGLPIPDNLPGKPEEIPPIEVPNNPDEVPPTDLPPEVSEVPPVPTS